MPNCDDDTLNDEETKEGDANVTTHQNADDEEADDSFNEHKL